MHTNISPAPSPPSAPCTSRKRASPPSSALDSAATPSKIPPPTTNHATTFTTPEGRKNSRSGPSNGSTVISRSIQACNRCRARKTRCDQQFPSCSACLKAGVECVGIDAATGREIPRSYVDWLEKRVKHLEMALKLEQQPPPEEEGEEDARTATIDPALQPAAAWNAERAADKGGGGGDGAELNTNGAGGTGGGGGAAGGGGSGGNGGGTGQLAETDVARERAPKDDRDANDSSEGRALHLRPDIDNLVNQVGLVGVQGTSASGFMGGSSGISFARLMFSAVKLTTKDSERGGAGNPKQLFGLPNPAPDAPDPAASSTVPRNRPRAAPYPFPPRETAEQLVEIYFQQANPQFPILFRPTFGVVFRRVCDRVELEGGCGAAVPANNGSGNLQPDKIQHGADLYFAFMCFAIASAMSQRTENLPERYHASAMQHVDCLFRSASFASNRLDGLKGVLLLALYSLMRPCSPGVWYVLGSALRLAVDMGLHQENTPKAEKTWDAVALDERRRLFWCTYSLDRQVCVYLGRPFGISDDAIKTPFPVDVDDEYITPNGIRPQPMGRKSSRTISLHMFRIRKLQSEIQQILYQTTEVPRRFQSLENWRRDMEARLQHWYDTTPKSQDEAGCGFNLSFVDLNYQQTRLLLYGLCPAVPLPSSEAFEIIADSGCKIIKAYRHLHREKSINYTWLACHNLFMAGTSYLCALWQSPDVRAATTIDQIDFHTLACVDVLSSLIERCPAAQTCRDVFDSLASSTVRRCNDQIRRPRSQTSNHSHHSGHSGGGHRAKRFRVESPVPQQHLQQQQPEWDYTPTPPPPPPPPLSLANLLLPPPTPPLQQQEYRYEYPQQQQQQQQGELDPLFRMPMDTGGMNDSGVIVGAGMDGSRLFEMIREVGSSGTGAVEYSGFGYEVIGGGNGVWGDGMGNGMGNGMGMGSGWV